MDITAPRPALGRRLVRGSVAVLAMVTLGLGLAATPALAAPKGGGGGCAAATDSFNANMKEARFWIDAADRLADAGNGEMADKASAEADHFLNQAEGALGGMGAAC
jgi:hypothetical protein